MSKDESSPTPKPPAGRVTLASLFGAPPFTVFDARQAYWQARKRQWERLGFRRYANRSAKVYSLSSQGTALYALKAKLTREQGRAVSWDEVAAQAKRRGLAMLPSISIFDPVLSELLCAWFTPPGGRILDPFAGGPVRGIVAAALGMDYVGVDLCAKQVRENRNLLAQAGSLPGRATWIAGDSRDLGQIVEGRFDFVFSCPPYGNLERYSRDPRDLSNMPWPIFLAVYRLIVAQAVDRLTRDRFAAFVVGDIRSPAHTLRNLVAETVRAFEEAGARLYNEAVLLTPAASAPIRAKTPFLGMRKLCKTHQNVLVFCLGDPVAAVGRLKEPALFDFGSLACDR